MERYSVRLRHSAEDGVWIAEVPELPGCMAHGRTRAAAERSIEELIPAWPGADGASATGQSRRRGSD